MTTFSKTNRITSAYGFRTLGGRPEFHRGVDLVPTAHPGQQLPDSAWCVREVTGGTVLRVAYDNSRGHYVDVQTATGTFERYQHMQSVCVKAGQAVPQGAVLGVAGNTGNSTGRHLHFGVYRGGSLEKNAVNPIPWLGHAKNKVGTYPGNDTLDGSTTPTPQPPPVNTPQPPKTGLYMLAIGPASAGDRDAVSIAAKQLGLTVSVKAV